ncbi:MAG: site-specific integrase [Candidatus Nanopelagicales bacterium]
MTPTTGTRRSNGEGHIKKYHDGWRGSVRVDGKRRYVRGRTRQEVVNKIRNLPSQRHADRPISVATWLESWVAQHSRMIRPSTEARYRGLIDHHLAPRLGHLPLGDLRPSHVNACLHQMVDSGQSASSAQQARAVLSRALKDAEAEGLVSRNAARLAARPRGSSQPISPLTPEESWTVLQKASTRNPSEYARRLLVLALGLRQGEVLGLTWDDIDFANSTIHIRAALAGKHVGEERQPLKTAASRRSLPLGHPLTTVLQEVRREQEVLASEQADFNPLGLVFVTSTGNQVLARNDHRQWQALLKSAGVKPRRLHDARHTAATAMHAAGLDMKDISTVLGHSTITLTADTYTHQDAFRIGDIAKMVINRYRSTGNQDGTDLTSE